LIYLTIFNMYCLYRHIREDKNEPFYIGIGKSKRAYSKFGRNSIWKKIAAKSEYKVNIILESENYEFIKQKEIEFIKLYGRKDLGTGTLCNLTDGGEGVLGVIYSDERRRKCATRTGSKASIETRAKMSEKGKLRYKNLKEIDGVNKIFQYSRDGNFIREWRSVNHAAIELGISKTNLRRLLKGNRISDGCFWKDNFEGLKINITSDSKIHRGKISQYDLDGNYINTFKSIKSASVECFGNRTGVNYINKVCKGLLNNYKKYIWKYENW